MKGTAADRGQYRVFFTRLLNGPSFLALGRHARAILYPLKLRLPPYGIAAIPAAGAVLAEDAALLPEEAAAGLDDLAEHGWIEREGNVIWLVRGLEFEPHLNDRDAKHRKYILAVIEALPSRNIVRRFVHRYANWFPEGYMGEPSEGSILSPNGGPPEGSNEGPPEPLSIKHESKRSHSRASQLPRRRRSTEGLSEDPSGESSAVVLAGGTAVGRTRSYEAVIERGKEALARTVELAQQEANAERLREEMITLTFAYWQAKARHPGALQDPKREAKIRERLRENRNDVSELLYAVDGSRRDKTLRGENSRGVVYDGISTIFRDREMVERLAALGGYDPGDESKRIHPQITALMDRARAEQH
jgi:hypothetical protein